MGPGAASLHRCVGRLEGQERCIAETARDAGEYAHVVLTRKTRFCAGKAGAVRPACLKGFSVPSQANPTSTSQTSLLSLPPSNCCPPGRLIYNTRLSCCPTVRAHEGGATAVLLPAGRAPSPPRFYLRHANLVGLDSSGPHLKAQRLLHHKQNTTNHVKRNFSLHH